jgi:DnaJ like chaperone protein
MAWWGTALGGTFGLLVGGPLGAMVGAMVGRGIDRGAERAHAFGHSVPDPARLKELFLETSFSVMGHLAKADGRVSETEIAYARSVMDRMGLSQGMRSAAILFFNQGKDPHFDLAEALGELRRAAPGRSPMLRLFLEIQMGAAYADKEPSPAQREVLERIRQVLNIPLASYRGLESLIQLQHRIFEAMGSAGAGAWGGGASGRGSAGARSPQSSLSGAYAVLGVEPKASDAEVKRAYRRLINRHHPDKLASRGLPEEAIKMASQKTQEIIRAYETVTQARGL